MESLSQGEEAVIGVKESSTSRESAGAGEEYPDAA